MDTRKLITHGAIPIGLSMIMIGMYFSGVDLLRSIIAPTIPWIYRTSERELGLLENVQNLILIIIIVLSIVGIRRKSLRFEKTVLAGLACFTLLVLLEEIDYGLHHYEYFSGIQAEDAKVDRNLHNVGKRTNTIKQIVDVFMVLSFLILPFALRNNSNRLIQYLLPDRYLGVTLIGCFLVSFVAHTLDDAGFAEGGKFAKNISEFREFMIYYLCTLYVWEFVLKRQWISPGPELGDTVQEEVPPQV